MLASSYHEIVVDQVFDGKPQLTTALQPLIAAAEGVLDLDAAKRATTIVRVDAGGGSLGAVNWLLSRGYAVVAKDYSSDRSARLAASVTTWFDDPKVSERQVGWVRVPPTAYVREVVRIAVRCRKANGQWGYGVLIAPVDLAPILALLGPEVTIPADDAARLLAYVYAYDRRGGGVETALRDDKQGLGLTKRNKKRFAAQQLLTMLGALAHNVIVWARRWLIPEQEKLAHYGMVRMVRDVFHITGRIGLDVRGHVEGIVLNQAAPLVRGIVTALQALLAPTPVAVNWGPNLGLPKFGPN